MIITNISTPANFFHAMRRQLTLDYRKPLINMSPKSLLRHPLAQSPIEAFEDNPDNSFYEFYDDPDYTSKNAKDVTQLLLCTGKIYYDLLERKQKLNNTTTAIVRVEQLYPFPKDMIDKIMKKYKNAEQYWVQEESENMGAWRHVYMQYPNIKVISRKASASPATGFKKVHEQQQEDILKKAFGK